MERWMLAARLVGVGFFIGISIALGIGLGYWLDTKLNTKPIFTLVGLFIGLAAAGYGVYQMILPLLNDKNGHGR